ncbi:SDR family oxidoreductase [Bacillus timonensis]|nr:SDR family oxidoreductase [Bacillus timonensis]
MNILLLGATGRVGSNILTLALQDHIQVTVLTRSPEKVLPSRNVTTIVGNVLDYSSLQKAMDGIHTVISCLGTDKNDTLSKSMPLIIKAMRKNGVSRIITIGTAGILQARSNPALYRFQSNESKRKSTKAAEDHLAAFQQLQQSQLDWTIVCPTYLPDGEKLGYYRIEKDFLPENGTKISVPDTAEFTYSLLEGNKFNKTRVGIAY